MNRDLNPSLEQCVHDALCEELRPVSQQVLNNDPKGFVAPFETSASETAFVGPHGPKP